MQSLKLVCMIAAGVWLGMFAIPFLISFLVPLLGILAVVWVIYMLCKTSPDEP